MTTLCLLCQSTALLLLGLLALRLTRRFGPSVQSLVGRASLAGVALLLLLAPLTGHIRPVVRVSEPTPQQAAAVPVREGEEVRDEGIAGGSLPKTNAVPAEKVSAAEAAEQETALGQKSAAEQEGAASSASPVPIPAPPAPRPPAVPATEERAGREVGSFSLAVTLALLLWLAVCQFHLVRLRRSAVPVTSGPAAALLAELTPNPPALLTHPSVHSPFLAGVRRPAIFLPPTFAADLAPDALRAVFLHELAHRDRRDNFWTLATRLLTAVFWFQPLLWLLTRKLEQISEDACDAAVLIQCPPRAYAACLLSLAERPPLARSQRTLTAGVAPFRSSIGRRIRHILTTQGVPPMLPLTLRLRLSVAVLTLVAALSGVFLISSAPAKNSAHSDGDSAHPGYAAQQFVGRIVYENGQPAAGVNISAGMTNSSRGWFIRYHEGEVKGTGAQTISRADGSYTLSGLRPSYHYNIVEQEASGKWVAAAIESVQLPNAVTRVPNLILTNGAVIEGIVTNKKTGKPMPSMYVYSLGPRYPASAGGASQTQTDKNGKYSMRVAPGSNWLYISGLGGNQGYMSGQISVSPMSTNLKYPVYDHGFPVIVAKGETKQVPIYAILPKGAAPIGTPVTAAAVNRAAYLRQLTQKLAKRSGKQPIANASNGPLNQAQFLAGLTPVQGPGVIVTLTDSKKPFSAPMPAGWAAPNLIHDSDINQVINELKAAGAEALSVNNQRLVATSAIRHEGQTVLINNTPQVPPYVIEAIGNPRALTVMLTMRGGEADQIKQFDPAMFSVKQAVTLTLPAYSGSSEPRYAKPVGGTAEYVADPIRQKLQFLQATHNLRRTVETYDSGRPTKEQQIAGAAAPDSGQSSVQVQKGFLQFRDKTQAELDADKNSLDQYEHSFQAELRQTLPEADAATLTKASNLESGLGGLISSRQFIQQEVTHYVEKHKHYASAAIAKKYAQANQRHLAEIRERQAEIKPLLAEEARLFPATADTHQHLNQVHIYAIKAHETGIHVMVDTAQLRAINYDLKRHQWVIQTFGSGSPFH